MAADRVDGAIEVLENESQLQTYKLSKGGQTRGQPDPCRVEQQTTGCCEAVRMRVKVLPQ
jgi:hypothetical protein